MTALHHRENDLMKKSGSFSINNGRQELTNENNNRLLVLKQATEEDGFTRLVPHWDCCSCLQRLRVNCLG